MRGHYYRRTLHPLDENELHINRPTATSGYTSLKSHLETKLNIARRAGARNLARRTAAEGCAGITKVGMIKQVKELGPEFQPDALGDMVVFNQRDIPFINPRSGQDITAGIPEARRSVR